MITPTVVSFARIGNVTSSHIGIEYITGIASTSVSSTQTLRLADVLATTVSDFTHVGRYACSLITMQFVSFVASAVVSTINVDAIVSATTIVLGTFVIVNAGLLI